eukprot:CAMPEP_0176042412 /NCGR_PEP_ID=MMETSP0120_2-20121206/21043_1 /TAXON_ID=160619 /ORGANISM="Kryptoperidinium foliaceum, Strain CCMP 1326" /LENGTH=242 /DNA_ID=CAMNT_0017375819 /DNA_START=27 /DNA_END=758 /DNA_ORIENTATION=-
MRGKAPLTPCCGGGVAYREEPLSAQTSCAGADGIGTPKPAAAAAAAEAASAPASEGLFLRNTGSNTMPEVGQGQPTIQHQQHGRAPTCACTATQHHEGVASEPERAEVDQGVEADADVVEEDVHRLLRQLLMAARMRPLPHEAGHDLSLQVECEHRMHYGQGDEGDACLLRPVALRVRDAKPPAAATIIIHNQVAKTYEASGPSQMGLKRSPTHLQLSLMALQQASHALHGNWHNSPQPLQM